MIDKYFPLKIELDESEVIKAKQFSELVVETDVYGFRNGQNNKARRQEQQFSSKLAEIAVCHYLKDWVEITEPDFSIKQRGDKSWDPDLKINKTIPVHVKSQDIKSKEKYGLSWIGEKLDKEMYINCTGYTALCLVNTDINLVEIYGFYETKYFKENKLFNETKLKQHREKKFAIYYKDLNKYPHNLNMIRWKLIEDARLLSRHIE